MTAFQPQTTLPDNPKRELELGRRLSGGAPSRNGDALVSVITVVYNNAATLQRCMDSVIAQTGVAIEYIVIDGGSTDGTLDVIRANADHIDYAVSEPDGGIYDAMNKGISLATGDYIALINSDDWLEPEGLKLSVDNMRAQEAEVSIGFANVWDKHNDFSHVWKIGNFDARILTSGMSFCHQALIASRHAYETVGPFDDTIRISADYKWIKALYLSGLKTVFTEIPVANFSFDGVAANNRPIWKAECKDLLTEQFPFLAKDDVSGFLEYVYRDAPLDQDAITNLIMRSGSSPILLQSIARVVLDKLLAHEIKNKNVVQAARRVPRKSEIRGALSVQADTVAPKPAISVIIPVYNTSDYLDQCIGSVLEQSFDDIEVICINDGSTDNSLEVLEAWAARDKRVRIFSRENGGASAARNFGWKKARGTFVHFLDSDDYIKPEMYAKLHAHAEAHDLDLVKSNLGFINNIYPTKRPPLPKGEVFAFRDCHPYVQFISISAALYRRTLLDRVDPFIEGIIYEDRPFNWQTIAQARRIGHVDEIFYMYRVDRPGSAMTQRRQGSMHMTSFDALDALHESLAKNGQLEEFKVEYVKEQLRVYSMLIDLDAIPRRAYGEFFWKVHARLNAADVFLDSIRTVNLPSRVKALFAFFLDGCEDQKLRKEGERYFFHGLNYQTTSKRYAGSSCELWMIGEYAVGKMFAAEERSETQAFRKAVFISSLFDHIHGTKLSSVEEVLDAISVLRDIILLSGEFEALVTAIHKETPSKSRASIDHLTFQYSNAPNYQATADVLKNYFAATENKFRSFTPADTSTTERQDELRHKERVVINCFRDAGFRSSSVSQVCETKRYLDKNLILDDVKTLTVLFPGSAYERYLIELLGDRCSLFFFPHGFPQVSQTTFSPDVVFSLTNGSEWERIFPDAQIVHLGWPEVIGAQPAKNNKAEKKTVLFLSQAEGSQVHKLDDFIMLTNLFLSAVLSIDPNLCNFILRLRNRNEIDLLDRDLFSLIQSRPNVTVSLLSDKPKFETGVDLIVAATSTGMLHSQHMEVPLLQCLSERLFQHWPYDVCSEGNRWNFQSGPRGLEEKILNVLDSKEVPNIYEVLSVTERHARLNEVYQNLEGRPDLAVPRTVPVMEQCGEIAFLEKNLGQATRIEQRVEKAEWSIAETRVFGRYNFINISVQNFLTAQGHRIDFYFKLFHDSENIGLELRQNDGSFDLLETPIDSVVESDDWGKKIILRVGPQQNWLKPVPKNAARGILSLDALIDQLVDGLITCNELSEEWIERARFLADAKR